MKVLSLFSGVGGFDYGLENAGMQTVFQCEIDKHCTKILERHWPDVPRWQDVRTLTGDHVLSKAEQVDVVAWGSPCQDLSIAGKRAGLAGANSNLFYEGIRIIKEMRQASGGRYPSISIWENVMGALNSNKGADFGRVIDEMAEAGALVIEWRCLDAKYFGVPQRRKRVFVVAVFDPAIARDCRDPILPISKSVCWHSKTSKEEQGDSAKRTSSGINSNRAIIESKFVGPLAASDHRFPQQQQVRENKCVVESLLLDSFRVNDVRVYQSPVQTLRKNMGNGGNNVPQLFQPKMAVRRLTPVECERLMGWPDNWTEGQTDGHRYKQCGNGVASPVAEWVGEQIMNIRASDEPTEQ